MGEPQESLKIQALNSLANETNLFDASQSNVGEKEQVVYVFIAARGPFTAEQLDQLATLGCDIGSVKGEVVYAKVAAPALASIVGLEFVARVEGTIPAAAGR